MEGATTNDIASMIERIAIAIGLIAMAIEKIVKAIKPRATSKQ